MTLSLLKRVKWTHLLSARGCACHGASQSRIPPRSGRRVALTVVPVAVLFGLAVSSESGNAQGSSHPPVINTSSAWSLGAPALASSDANGVPGNGSSAHANFSPDGTHVAFWSSSTNLVPGATNPGAQWYIKDLANGTIALASADVNGVEANSQSPPPPNNSCQVLMFSPDGKRVVFNSLASNLALGATNGDEQIFLKDLTTGTVTLVSADANGVQGNNHSFNFAFSPDGTRVAFFSSATNLLPSPTHVTNVLVKNLTNQAVTLASADVNGVEGNGDSNWPVFSPDGTGVVFASSASNLLAGSVTLGSQIYVKNLQTGVVTLASADANGVAGNGLSLYPMFSPDGSKVTFDSVSTNLVPGVTSGTLDIYVKDLATGAITL